MIALEITTASSREFSPLELTNKAGPTWIRHRLGAWSLKTAGLIEIMDELRLCGAMVECRCVRWLQQASTWWFAQSMLRRWNLEDDAS